LIELENIYDEEGGFFAWGAISGPVNERNWKAMRVGDWVLSVYDGFYHYAMQVKGKYENEELAKKVWGTNENNETWKFMYFLKRPQIPNIGPVPLIQLQSYLNRRYQGFWKISDEKIDRIENEFGSIEKFIEQMVLGVKFQGKVGKEFQQLKEKEETKQQERGAFDPNNINDARKRVVASIVQRQGQPQFRKSLLKNYGGCCAITGCDVPETLEAAHIIPYKGEETNHPSNGILLRADLHTLFDLGFISIEPSKYIVQISSQLKGSSYEKFDGQKIYIPKNELQKPNYEALKQHQIDFGYIN